LLNQNFHLLLASIPNKLLIYLAGTNRSVKKQRKAAGAEAQKQSSVSKHVNQIIYKRCNKGKYSVNATYYHIMEVLVGNTHLREEGD